MEKLERVLAVEESARHAVAGAVEQAAGIRAAAVEQARALEADSAMASIAAVAAQRDALVSEARAEAQRLTFAADTARTQADDTARGRLDAVVTSLATRFEG